MSTITTTTTSLLLTNSNHVQFVLYLGAPFFGYPHKPILNALVGSSYERAYAHFRRDHNTDLNIGFHLVCLVLQLIYNYGLLTDLDVKMKSSIGLGGDILSTSTLLLWSASLISQTNAPPIVKVASCLVLWAGYRCRHLIYKNWKLLAFIQAILEVIALHVFVLKNGIGYSNTAKITGGGLVNIDPVSFIIVLAIRLAIYLVVKSSPASSFLGKMIVNIGVVAYMLVTCQDPWGKTPPFLIGFIGWALALLTDQPWLFFYSGGFLGSVMQGVSHHYSQEPATLPALTQVADEMAHATYFPNLLLQSMHQSLKARNGWEFL
jgi:hypothetical protein